MAHTPKETAEEARRRAGDPSTSARELFSLASHTDAGVRERVAGNPATPEYVLLLLNQDADYMVRAALANNHATPAAVLAGLSQDPSFLVRQFAASNPTTTAPVRWMLLNDASAPVRHGALSRWSDEDLAGLYRQVDAGEHQELSTGALVSIVMECSLRQIVNLVDVNNALDPRLRAAVTTIWTDLL